MARRPVPRAKSHPLTVARGPVPRAKSRPFAVARGPVPRDRFFCLNQDLQDDRIYRIRSPIIQKRRDMPEPRRFIRDLILPNPDNRENPARI